MTTKQHVSSSGKLVTCNASVKACPRGAELGEEPVHVEPSASPAERQQQEAAALAQWQRCNNLETMPATTRKASRVPQGPVITEAYKAATDQFRNYDGYTPLGSHSILLEVNPDTGDIYGTLTANYAQDNYTKLAVDIPDSKKLGLQATMMNCLTHEVKVLEVQEDPDGGYLKYIVSKKPSWQLNEEAKHREMLEEAHQEAEAKSTARQARREAAAAKKATAKPKGAISDNGKFGWEKDGTSFRGEKAEVRPHMYGPGERVKSLGDIHRTRNGQEVYVGQVGQEVTGGWFYVTPGSEKTSSGISSRTWSTRAEAIDYLSSRVNDKGLAGNPQ